MLYNLKSCSIQNEVKNMVVDSVSVGDWARLRVVLNEWQREVGDLEHMPEDFVQ